MGCTTCFQAAEKLPRVARRFLVFNRFFSFCCLVAELEARSLCEASRDLGSYARSFELLSPAVAPQRQACGMPSRLAAYHAFSYVRTEKGGIGGNYKCLMIVLGHVALWGCLLRSLQ